MIASGVSRPMLDQVMFLRLPVVVIELLFLDGVTKNVLENLLFIAETFWSLRNFGHVSHCWAKTRCNSVHWPIFSDILTENDLIFFGHFKNVSVQDQKKTVEY